ncbi:Fructose dehydrogenase cytochrome subunit precursor [Rhodobacteraceae bacterium THAF1]|uniref:cytochrome c n=1 Tax=Palleronia sp. THAF1 TaxID=2587842 RepID=UPI000F3F951A|nr:cytochrome c [Palleronia sp. THAF1]QFU08586.1 Fructose dehydrogenase cytochrome subunit precursor [Palleronia sp. THAF1]VDC30669.1 Fructose dehydrogenase cytochrome subunit precursor [Rhodobacteraceae bacterium THAF1]
MRFPLLTFAAIAAAGAAVGWWITAPDPLTAADLDGITGDATRGEALFVQAGCASCHIGPDSDSGLLSGGQAFQTAFGTFYAPNISPGSEGTGDWTEAQLVSALMRGVGPGGYHLYPALPYTSYENADPQDVADIAAHLATLPVSDQPSQPHELSFPFNIRRTLGAWKFLYADRGWVLDAPATPEIERGRYLAEALFHCGQCHTPRTALGGMDRERWLQGGPNPNGRGDIPGIAPNQLDWSDKDVAAYLKTGLTPDYDSAGGHMAAVVRNLSTLPDKDIDAIVAYLRAIPETAQE